MTKLTKTIMAAMAMSLAIGCGGASKQGAPTSTGLGDNKVPKPPTVGQGAEGGATKAEDISADARRDYQEAVKFFQAQEKSGWNRGSCEEAASRFASVGGSHSLVEARYMAGLSYQQCGMKAEAEKAYQSALQINKAHARSLSNLGEIYFKDGKEKGARDYWEAALKSDSKLTAARNNLAWLLIEQLRKTGDRSAWARIEKEARDHLSSVLAVDNDNVRAYVLYGLVYMEGHERNKNRLDLANLLLEEGEKRSKDYAPLYNAKGLLQLHRQNLGRALEFFGRAVQLDSEFVEARMNVGNITLGFRKYDEAEAQFTKVLELEPKNYDAMIGLGIAQRGLGKLSDAEASYNKAIQLDGNAGAAYFNLGVLYKDFLANKASDIKESQGKYKQAQEYFQKFLSKGDASAEQKKEAEANIADCKKIVGQIDDVIKAMEQAEKDKAAGGN